MMKSRLLFVLILCNFNFVVIGVDQSAALSQKVLEFTQQQLGRLSPSKLQKKLYQKPHNKLTLAEKKFLLLGVLSSDLVNLVTHKNHVPH